MRDLNAKLASANTGSEQVMARHGLGEMNENGEFFANRCENQNMVIRGTVTQKMSSSIIGIPRHEY